MFFNFITLLPGLCFTYKREKNKTRRDESMHLLLRHSFSPRPRSPTIESERARKRNSAREQTLITAVRNINIMRKPRRSLVDSSSLSKSKTKNKNKPHSVVVITCPHKYNQHRRRFSESDSRPIILFDGVCNLCHGGVNFVLDTDNTPDGALRFAALQSELGKIVIRQSRKTTRRY